MDKIDIHYFDNNYCIDNYNYNSFDFVVDIVNKNCNCFDIIVDYYKKYDFDCLSVECYYYYNFDCYFDFVVFIDYSQILHLEMNSIHSFIFLLPTFVIHYFSYFVNDIYYLFIIIYFFTNITKCIIII